MHVYFTTVVRGAPNRKAGELVCLDWERKEIVRRQPMTFGKPYVKDPNPRGNTRGGRGVAAINGKIVAATYHTLRCYDRSLAAKGTLSHPLLAGLHELHIQRPGKLWATSTAIDLALELDMGSGKVVRTVSPRDLPRLQRDLSLEPLGLDLTRDHRTQHVGESLNLNSSHLHLNAVCSWQNDLFALLSSKGAVVNLDRDEVLLHQKDLASNHNLHIRKDGLGFVNHTYGPAIHCIDFDAGKFVDRTELNKYHWVKSRPKGP